VLGEPAALPCGRATEFDWGRLELGHPETTCAADVSDPLIAAFENYLLELRRPAQQHPPAANGARPLF